jgi:hypothetical protein
MGGGGESGPVANVRGDDPRRDRRHFWTLADMGADRVTGYDAISENAGQ